MVLLVGSFDELAGVEDGAGVDEGDQVGCVDGAPAGLGGLNELERHGQPGGLAAGSAVSLVRCRTVANVDSIGLVVRRWIQCSAG